MTLPTMRSEVAYWREAIQKWTESCPCTCDACITFGEAIAEAARTFLEQYGDVETPKSPQEINALVDRLTDDLLETLDKRAERLEGK